MARFSLLSVLVAFLLAISANALALEKRASLQQVTNYGANPANVPMYIYVPDKLATKPGIIVAVYVFQFNYLFRNRPRNAGAP